MGHLSDVTRRRLAVLLLAVGALVGVAAASDAGPFADPATPEERAQQAVLDFFAAANGGDYRTMCSLMTPATQTQVLQRTAALLRSGQDVGSCPEALAAQAKGSAAGRALTGTHVAKVDDSRVSGNRAAVDVELSFPGQKGREPRTFELELVHDRWKISGSAL
jgi:hypothetical protein